MALKRRIMCTPSQFLLVALLLLSRRAAGEEARRAPWFATQPPARAVFAAAAGARLACAARGDPPPALVWLGPDNQELHSDHHRRVYSNGTLELAPAAGAAAGGVLRCRASNVHGVALSVPVTLVPVAEDSWDAVLTAAPAAAGGVASLTCAGAGAGAGLGGGDVEPALWYRGDRVIDVPPPSPESRYLLAGNSLLIRDVAARDAGAYGCLARHRATRRSRRAPNVELRVSQGEVSAAPPPAAALSVRAAAGALACLPCAGAHHPAPHYTWYREHAGRLQPVGAAGGAWPWAGGAALCVRAARAAAGTWLCKAYSARGDATARLHLAVDLPLTVELQPPVLVAETGSTVQFNCSSSDPEATLSWMHDGAPVSGGPQASGDGARAALVLRAVSRAARGVYQCEARRGAQAAQASAELRLGESAPELQYTFIEQALRPGGDVALRCAAAAAPSPRLAWLLDAQPLAHYRAPHRYTVTEEAGAAGEVVSVLRLRALTAADGGRYTCRAHNAHGAAEHSARLNVYGPPSIRAVGPVRVVAGANATIYCPYAGYPISEVAWWRGGARMGGAGRVAARGAALRLRPALPPDRGAYACSAAAADGQLARQDIEIQVRNPPKISPFMFSSELTEGSSAQALCGVSSGDKPLYFSWLKDGAPLPAELQVQEKSLGEFSLLVFPALAARHSGAYTCRVANHAASANYTAVLSVKVAPSWTTEPADAAVLLGAPLSLECAARGHPTPVVTWYRKIGESPSNLESDEQWEEVVGGEWGPADGAVARGGALSAAAAARRLQGRYRCRADNGVGAPLLKHVNVTVHEPAHFEATEPRNVSAVRGQAAALWCRARGDAPLSLTWSRLGRRLDFDSFRWSVSESGGGGAGEALRSELRLRAVERADAGEYRCLAANHYGRAEMLLYLHVEEPPDAPEGLRLAGVGARWVRLAWRAGGAARYWAQYSSLHAPPGAEPLAANLSLESPGALDADLSEANTLSAVLTGLRPAAAYSLRTIAANHVGSSPPSAPLLFTTLEEAPSSAPQDVRVRAVAPGELLVSWTAPPRDTWNGELLGYAISWRALSGADEDESADGPDPRRAGELAAAGWARAELALNGLRRFARYAVTLRAYNRAGASPPAPAVYASTADGVPAEAPSGVRCAAEAGALRVWWAPPPAAPGPPSTPPIAGYDVHYALLYDSPAWSGPAGGGVAAAAAGAASTALRGLRAAANYSVRVAARSAAGAGPASAPVVCSTLDEVPGAVRSIRALPASASAVLVSWLTPPRSLPTHYTLYTKERDKMGGEWSQRVEAGEGEEARHEVRGLRERAVYEFWLRAHSAAGAGEPGRVVAASPSRDAPVRISSWARTIRATLGTRVRLGCTTAGGVGVVRRRWTPLPRRHSITAAGDLVIHELEPESAGNYTCQVAGAGGAGDAAEWRVEPRAPPAPPPAPRLLRAARTQLLLAWDAPAPPLNDDDNLVLGYTLWWSREPASTDTGAARSLQVPAGARGGGASRALAGLACGARHRVWLRAHSAAGASPPSPPLLVATTGHQAPAPPGSAFIWANSSALRLNLLVWRAGPAGGAGGAGAGAEPPCPVARWSAALRPAAGGSWVALDDDGETAEVNGLEPGTWYELRVAAHGAATITRARYRAATHAVSGERIGEPVELEVEESVPPAGAEGAEGEARAWRGGLAPAMAGGALAALLAAGAAAVLRARRAAAPPPLAPAPHPQLYTTEPGKRNGKTLTPPDGSLEEISPYATFSMGEARRGCALHLRTFGRASPLALAAPPARPNLLHPGAELCRGCDSDSESSGSPCAACAAPRAPAAPAPRRPRATAESLSGLESGAEETSRGARGRGRRRREPPAARNAEAARTPARGERPACAPAAADDLCRPNIVSSVNKLC